MKIDYYYPDLGLWVTLWAEKPGRFDALWWTQKQKLKRDIYLAVTDALGPVDVPASAADAAENLIRGKPVRMPDADADDGTPGVVIKMPDGDDDEEYGGMSGRLR